MVEALRLSGGGFLCPFGCAWFIREFLHGHGPYGSPSIDPDVGNPQAESFYHYKIACAAKTAAKTTAKTSAKTTAAKHDGYSLADETGGGGGGGRVALPGSPSTEEEETRRRLKETVPVPGGYDKFKEALGTMIC